MPVLTETATRLDERRLAAMTVVTPTLLLEELDGRSIWIKLEHQQPSGSTKDRVAAAVLRAAIRGGQLTSRSTVVEASSGSTSVSFAMGCAHLGIRFVAVMPENVTAERALMIRRLGAEVVLTPATDGMAGSLAVVEAMDGDDGVFLPRQFENPVNTDVHRRTTARELIEAVVGPIGGFVAGIGTGGTLTGVARGLRAHYTDVVIGEAAPRTPSGLVSGAVPGVVAGYSKLLDHEPVDTAVAVPEGEALATARELAARGFPVGPSSGLNVAAARRLALELPVGTAVATVLPDRMERYFSAELFDDLRSRSAA